eukprot:TRINITY_DN1547_c1_g1_i1.p1 TRINITY_DN1547_c1_g1~~TRINITY_DN1547_c1_g1_i1.p1  ORF type:complete len:1238 (+),score=343.89 TRINITY_DN1547_c1_g1_i1:76-3714(+)
MSDDAISDGAPLPPSSAEQGAPTPDISAFVLPEYTPPQPPAADPAQEKSAVHRQRSPSGPPQRPTPVEIPVSEGSYESRSAAAAGAAAAAPPPAGPRVALFIAAALVVIGCDAAAAGRAPLWLFLHPVGVACAMVRGPLRMLFPVAAAVVLAGYVALRSAFERAAVYYTEAQSVLDQSDALFAAEVACRAAALCAAAAVAALTAPSPAPAGTAGPSVADATDDLLVEFLEAVLQFDIDSADAVLARWGDDDAVGPVQQRLVQLLTILNAYRPYLPDTLFGAPLSSKQEQPSQQPFDNIEIRTPPHNGAAAARFPPRYLTDALSLSGGFSDHALCTPDAARGRQAAGSHQEQATSAGSLDPRRRGSNTSSAMQRCGTGGSVQLNPYHVKRPHRDAQNATTGGVDGRPAAANRKSVMTQPGAADLQGPEAIVRMRRGTVLRMDNNIVAARLDTGDVFTFGAQWASAVISAIRTGGGVVDRLRCDAISAVWNTHVPSPRHAAAACHCAVGIVDDVTELLKDSGLPWFPSQPKLRWNGVIATSNLFVGQVGNHLQMAPFVHGPAAAQAAYLMPLGRLTGAPVLLTEGTRELVDSVFSTRPVDVVPSDVQPATPAAAAAAHTMFVYELIDQSPNHGRTEYSEAFNHFTAGRWSAAARAFEALHERHPDTQTQRMRLLCEAALSGDVEVPVPYVRANIGWAGYEEAATSGAAPALKVMLSPRAPGSMAVMPSPAIDTPLVDGLPRRMSERTWLREAIRKSRTPLAGHNSGKSAFPAGTPSIGCARSDSIDRPPSIHGISSPMYEMKHVMPQSIAAKRRRSSVRICASPAGGALSPLVVNSELCDTPMAEEEDLLDRTGDKEGCKDGDGDDDSWETADEDADQLFAPAVVPVPRDIASTSVLGSRWQRSERMLGRGTFGEVWLGMQEDGGLIALKCVRLPPMATAEPEDFFIMSPRRCNQRPVTQADLAELVDEPPPPDIGMSQQRLEDCLSEVNLLSTLGHHDNVTSYIGSAVVCSWVVMAMEYVSGGALSNVLEQFPGLPFSSVRRYTRDICKGLRFLHGEGVLHRDLKPANVLLCTDGTCKLADFGAAATLSHLAGAPGGSEVVGTPLYMAPEACKGRGCAQSDVWAAGLTCCQLLCGRVPFPQEAMREATTFMYRLGSDTTFQPVVPDDEIAAKHGGEIGNEQAHVAANFCRRCLCREADRRPLPKELLTDPFLV